MFNIKNYYPKYNPKIVATKLNEKLKNKIYEEIKSSKYGESITEYVKTCYNISSFTYPNVATINVIHCDNSSPSISIVIRTLKRIYSLIKLLNINKELVFYLLPTPYNRLFPNKNEKVNVEHINGGYTYPMGNQIYIFRWEEFPKVMLHETIHHSLIDTGISWNYDDMMLLYKKLNIDASGCPNNCSTQLIPNEAIVETWAEIYHMKFLEYEYGFSFKRMLEQEKKWSIIQAKRILKHQGEFYPLWKEGSHSYSYMVIRSAILWNITEFQKLNIPYNTTILTRFILISMSNTKFINALKKIEIPKHNSFRMTLYGNL